MCLGGCTITSRTNINVFEKKNLHSRSPFFRILARCASVTCQKIKIIFIFIFLGVEEDDIKDCCYRMICLYNRQKANQEELESIVDGLRKKLDEERRALREYTNAQNTPNQSSPASRSGSPIRSQDSEADHEKQKNGTGAGNGNNGNAQIENSHHETSMSNSPKKKKHKHKQRSRSRSRSYDDHYHRNKSKKIKSSKRGSMTRSPSSSPPRKREKHRHHHK